VAKDLGAFEREDQDEVYQGAAVTSGMGREREFAACSNRFVGVGTILKWEGMYATSVEIRLPNQYY